MEQDTNLSRKNFYSNYLNFIFWYLLIFVLSVSFLGLVTAFVTTHHFSQQNDKKIELESNQLMVDYQQDGLEELWNDVKERVQLNQPNRLLYSIVLKTGERDFDKIKVLNLEAGFHDVTAPTELRAFVTPLKDGHSLVVATSLNDMRSLEKIIASNFVFALFLIILLGIIGGVILSGRYVKRITEMQAVTTKIGEGNFESRIPLNGSNDVFDEIAKIFNSMLDRIQVLVHEIQRVSSNVAHEMRTPLGHVRQKMEYILQQAELNPNDRTLVEEAIEELDQTLNMFAATMRLSEINSGTRKAHFKKINLSKTIIDVCELYEGIVHEGKRALMWNVQPDVFSVGDSSLIKQLVVNVIENFIQHTPPAAEMNVSLSLQSDHIVLSFKDNGLGIENLEYSVQAFHSSHTSKGAGLGLSLIEAIARLHDYSWEYQNTKGFGIIFQIPK